MESPSTIVNNDTDPDRISELTDPILHQILSHLMTKHVVRTMILSKRWKSLWASMPYFFVDDYKDDILCREGNPNFLCFVNAMLILRDASNIHTFQLCWACGINRYGCGQHHLNTWVEHVVNHNVKVLEIDIRADKEAKFGHFVRMPNFIFACQTVEEMRLKIDSLTCYLHPPHIMLGRLRKLHLKQINLEFDLGKLIYGCPVLQDLNVQECMLSYMGISSNVLRKLNIESCTFFETEIQIHAPSLHSFCLDGNTIFDDIELVEALIGNLSSLVDASIQLYCIDFAIPFRFPSLGSKCILGDPRSSTFYNLKKLVLKYDSIEDRFEEITYFLQLSPNLEKLVLEEHNFSERSQTELYDCPHLKMEIEYKYYKDYERIIELVEDFLLSECDCPFETQ